MSAQDGFAMRALRYLNRLVMMPHRVTEVLIRLRALEGRLPGAAPTAAPADGTPWIDIFSGYGPQDLRVFDDFVHADPQPMRGWVTDFIGTRTRTSSLWNDARQFDGKVTPRPVPHDLYEAIEWIGLLRAVAEARDGRFVMAELGAGFGPWIGAGASAARLRGIHDFHLTGVEADPGRFALMEQHMADNGVAPGQQRLYCAAVGVEVGHARWPRIADPANASGGRPIREGAEGIDRDDAAYIPHAVEDHIDVRIVPLAMILAEHPVWDLLHVDVQGWETRLCAGTIDDLNAKVRRMVIGTHSRVIDGQLIEILTGAGWVLENEKPSRFTFDPAKASIELMTEIDGTQIWRNPRLTDRDAAAGHRGGV